MPPPFVEYSGTEKCPHCHRTYHWSYFDDKYHDCAPGRKYYEREALIKKEKRDKWEKEHPIRTKLFPMMMTVMFAIPFITVLSIPLALFHLINPVVTAVLMISMLVNVAIFQHIVGWVGDIKNWH
jgi:hypothetical protein